MRERETRNISKHALTKVLFCVSFQREKKRRFFGLFFSFFSFFFSFFSLLSVCSHLSCRLSVTVTVTGATSDVSRLSSLIGLSVHSLRFSRLSSSPRARAAFSSSPLRKSRENNSAEEKKRKKRGEEEEEEEEEEEAFFSFLRAHFYCLKYPRLHLNASARAS